MTVILSRENTNFLIEDSDILVELALAMAKLKEQWGGSDSKETLAKNLFRTLTVAKADGTMTPVELRILERNSEIIILNDELASSFARMESSFGEKPRFQSTLSDAINTVRDYALSLGCEIVINIEGWGK